MNLKGISTREIILYNYCIFQVEYVNLLTLESIIPWSRRLSGMMLSRVNKFTYSTRNVQLLFYHNENPTQQAPDVVAILYQNIFHIDSTKLVGFNVESMLIKCWVPAGYVRQNEKKYWEQSRSHHFQWWLKERPYICQFKDHHILNKSNAKYPQFTRTPLKQASTFK